MVEDLRLRGCIEKTRSKKTSNGDMQLGLGAGGGRSVGGREVREVWEEQQWLVDVDVDVVDEHVQWWWWCCWRTWWWSIGF
jgi:hypothetical protein